MKATFYIFAVILLTSAGVYAKETYWEVFCNSEGRVIANEFTNEEAVKRAQRHSFEAAHTVTVSEKIRDQ